jgi:hypothetical protein
MMVVGEGAEQSEGVLFRVLMRHRQAGAWSLSISGVTSAAGGHSRETTRPVMAWMQSSHAFGGCFRLIPLAPTFRTATLSTQPANGLAKQQAGAKRLACLPQQMRHSLHMIPLSHARRFLPTWEPTKEPPGHSTKILGLGKALDPRLLDCYSPYNQDCAPKVDAVAEDQGGWPEFCIRSHNSGQRCRLESRWRRLQVCLQDQGDQLKFYKYTFRRQRRQP